MGFSCKRGLMFREKMGFMFRKKITILRFWDEGEECMYVVDF
jgi:hypothetical protein